MKILLINKYYHDRSKSGGVGRHILQLQKLLERQGHEVIPFAMRQAETIPNSYLDHFPGEFDLSEVDLSLNGLHKAGKIFYNREAARKLDALTRNTKPDVAHLHNIYHHLSTSVLRVLKKHRVPVVMTVHDYKLISPNYTLFAHGKICERCERGNYLHSIFSRCIKNSYAASAVLALEAFYTRLFKVYHRGVDIFVAPSHFMAERLEAAGYEKEKIMHISNFFEPASGGRHVARNSETSKSAPFVIYAGRLSAEKGLDTLLQAMSLIEDKSIHLVIAGSGSEQEALERQSHSLGIAERVKFTGYLNQQELQNYLQQARCVIVPSRWHENAPYAILEAYAAAKSVIAARIGGMPEMVKEGETGWTYDYKDARQLARLIDQAAGDKETCAELGGNARKFLRRHFGAEGYYKQLMQVYNLVQERVSK